jgi:predicted secreted protein
MANFREDVLRGFGAAQRMHKVAAVRERYLKSSGQIDVYRLAADLDIPVMFRDLDGLLGAYLADPIPGILVTKKRPVSVQRFTCAHELGHHYLKHQASLDSEEDIGFALSGGPGANERERQADAFAFSFLMPKWLLINNLKRLAGIGLRVDAPSAIDRALAIYQLSLRVGCSFTATINTLRHYALLPDHVANGLCGIAPRTIKEHLLGDIMVPNWHRDVWLITEVDDGVQLDASQDDLFVIRVHEPSTAGYLTRLRALEENGFTVLREGYVRPPDQGNSEVLVGTFPEYEAVAQHPQAGTAALEVVHERSWEPPEMAERALYLEFDVTGVPDGLSPQERRKRLDEVLAHG